MAIMYAGTNRVHLGVGQHRVSANYTRTMLYDGCNDLFPAALALSDDERSSSFPLSVNLEIQRYNQRLSCGKKTWLKGLVVKCSLSYL